MEAVALVFWVILLVILIAVLCALIMAMASVVCMTLWALIKPHVSAPIDRWMDWFDRRTS
ncbi:MAG: hypothetical protein HFJ74_00875 [Eggerthellaceae bacterium]|jgi:hypothetical protein|nr:hypothetical protein [Eggerthellaceae bacterium]